MFEYAQTILPIHHCIILSILDILIFYILLIEEMNFPSG